jgi:hypothetical protein
MQYISVEHQRAISGRYKTAAIIVFAHCVTVLIFIVVARFVQPAEVVPGSERLVTYAPAAVIILTLAAIIFRRVWSSQVVFGSAMKLGVNAVLNRLMQMTVVCAAISELVAIFGLAFYLLTGGYQYSLVLSAVSLMLLFYTAFPRRGEWERAVAASANAKAA